MEVENLDNHKKRKKTKLDELDPEKKSHMEVENLDKHKKRKKTKLDERDSEKKSHISSEKRKKKIKLVDHGLESLVEVKSCSRETCIDNDKKEGRKKKKRSKTAGKGSMEEGVSMEDYTAPHEKRKHTTEDDASEKQNNFDVVSHSLTEEKEKKKNKNMTKGDKFGSEKNNVREGKKTKKEKEKAVYIKVYVLKERNVREEEICNSNDTIKKRKKKKSKSKEHGTLEEAQSSNDSKRKELANKKTKSAKSNLDDNVTQNNHKLKKKVQAGDHSRSPTSGGTSRRVSFSDNVEIFSLPDDEINDKSSEEDGEAKDNILVQGKRFSKEEDAKVKKAVLNYIETHNLGEKGLHMVLHCKSFS